MPNINVGVAVAQTVLAEAAVIGAHVRYYGKLVQGIENSKFTAGPQLFAPLLKVLGPVGLVVAVSYFGTVFFQPPSPPAHPSLLFQAFQTIDRVDACLFFLLCCAIWAAIADNDCGPTKKERHARALRGSSWIPRKEVLEVCTTMAPKTRQSKNDPFSTAVQS